MGLGLGGYARGGGGGGGLLLLREWRLYGESEGF